MKEDKIIELFQAENELLKEDIKILNLELEHSKAVATKFEKEVEEQDAEIERLKARNDELNALNKTASIEAIKEFWASLKEIAYVPNLSLTGEYVVDVSDGDNLVAEMVGDTDER